MSEETPEASVEIKLPEWFATKGPAPYWLAKHWALTLSLLTPAVVLLNTLLTVDWINASPSAQKWINAGAALLASLALYLRDRQPSVEAIAAWREQVRAAQDSDETNEHLAGPDWAIPPPEEDDTPGKHAKE